MWVGGGQENVSYNLPAPCAPMSMVTAHLTYSYFEMHNSVDSVNVVPQHETYHRAGWGRESLIWAIQAPWEPTTYQFCSNIVLVAILHYTSLYYIQVVEFPGTSPWCTIYDGHHGPSALKTHWKLVLIYDSEICLTHLCLYTMLTVSKYLLITPRRNGSFGHSAEPQKPGSVFMAPIRQCC